MTMERMPVDKVSSPRPRAPDASDAPTLFDDDIFLQTARNIVEETPIETRHVDPEDGRLDFSKLEETTTGPIQVIELPDETLERKFEELEKRADKLSDTRGISIALALDQLDTEGIVAEMNKREAERSRQAEKQAALDQANTNAIAIAELRKTDIAARRKAVAAAYREGSFEQKQALTEFDAREVVKAERRDRRS